MALKQGNSCSAATDKKCARFFVVVGVAATTPRSQRPACGVRSYRSAAISCALTRTAKKNHNDLTAGCAGTILQSSVIRSRAPATFGCYAILGYPRTQTSSPKKKKKKRDRKNAIYPPPRAPKYGRPGFPFGFLFSGCWRALAKDTAWAGFYSAIHNHPQPRAMLCGLPSFPHCFP